ncbi:NAD(P)/FAD-dependent oxidoreductase [Bacillus sp. B15-48]|uniref:NAD(P)/FAD-dependent oxidoreductase n=1 Tax=Bacillus sp. B15-48 TaxID=1548601 RepID=UPI00193ECF99|nr:NAD(P)/FAD-dependent oxidoreductase [Bacillus sp. B15-48]MBM4763359.1 NAD(P)-binding protein [Bacillus sp. B15-48]
MMQQTAKKVKYPKLFEPGQIGGLKLKNRLTMSPMGSFLDNADASLNDIQLEYYEKRAAGGVGLVHIEAQYITNKTDPWIQTKTIADTDAQGEGWAILADRIHAHGAKMGIQLSIGLGRNGFLFGNQGQMVSASAIPSHRDPDHICRALTVEDIHYLVGCYERAAQRALKAGVDLLQIHAHAGYLLDQFMTPLWNKRTDEYGGSFENRMRIVKEAYEAIRNVVGPDFPITIRLGGYHDFPGGREIEESIEICQYLEKLGFDALDIDLGAYERKQWIVPTPVHGMSSMAHAAAEIKNHVNIPVINAGTHTPETAEALLAEGAIDFVQLGRPLIADPDLPNKLLNNQEEDIRPCLFCNEMCDGYVQLGKGITCSINPVTNFRLHYPDIKVDVNNLENSVETPKNIAIIGGGPAGMEAARIAAMRGHSVTIYERNGTLGGQINIASGVSFKHRLKKFTTHQQIQLRKLGVNVVLNKEISADSPELATADHIIVALGSRPVTADIKGIERTNVIEIQQAHIHPELIVGDKVIIAGGGRIGTEFALELGRKGKEVIVVEKGDEVAHDLIIENRNPLMFKLEEVPVEILTNHEVTEFTDKGVIVQKASGEVIEIEGDTVIAAFGRRSYNELADQICEKYSSAVRAGESIEKGHTGIAVHSGFIAGLTC